MSFLASVIEEIERFWEDSAPAEAPDRPLATVRGLCERFHHVVKALGARQRDRSPLTVEDEYDVQYLLRALLKVHFDDVRREENTPSYAGSSARMDFILKPQGLVVEAKMTRPGLGDKQVGKELKLDIADYKGHPDCRTLVCFVYDPAGHIHNAAALADLNGEHDGLTVVVIVAPT